MKNKEPIKIELTKDQCQQLLLRNVVKIATDGEDYLISANWKGWPD